jgi:hypothetical protein
MQLLAASKGQSSGVVLSLHLKMFCVMNMIVTQNQNHQQCHNIIWKYLKMYLETKLMNINEFHDEIRR